MQIHASVMLRKPFPVTDHQACLRREDVDFPSELCLDSYDSYQGPTETERIIHYIAHYKIHTSELDHFNYRRFI